MSNKKEEKALIHFNLGPVQKFIESARTSRDLWMGSYLLSWLTAKAAATALKGGAKELGGACVLSANPLVKKHGGENVQEGLLASCLPNTFILEFDGSDDAAQDLSKKIEEAVREEWKTIAGKVRILLDKQWSSVAESVWTTLEEECMPWLESLDDNAREIARDWDGAWEEQIEGFWDIRVTVLPGGLDDDDLKNACKKFGYEEGTEKKEDADERVRRRIFLVGALASAARRMRHYPIHELDCDRRPKCFQTGVQSAMGPMHPKVHRLFWEQVLEMGPEEWRVFHGERLRSQEKLGAIALVKRFAWVSYFEKELGGSRRMIDTATIAAAGWLAETEHPGRVALRERAFKKSDYWSGQWLFMGDPMKETKANDTPAKEQISEIIHSARKVDDRSNANGQPQGIYTSRKFPPRYYAILMLDGDKIGNLMRNASTKKAANISQAIGEFALKDVPGVIEKYLGKEYDLNQPLYAGGDDVLAMLPLMMPGEKGSEYKTVLSCARDINAAFVEKMREYGDSSTSAGIAIAHFKEDLRDVLDAARGAEKAAKRPFRIKDKDDKVICEIEGRNRLAISVMRRGGQGELGFLKWDHINHIEDLVLAFAKNEITDRWTYILRQEWKTLAENDLEEKQKADMIDAEVARLLARSEKRQADDKRMWKAWEQLKMMLDEEKCPVAQRHNALQLMQFASFIARGED